MTPWTWCTREPCPREFDRAWRRILARAPHANFTLALEYLDHRARQGHHAFAMIAERNGMCGAAVLRECGPRYESGWPWRWQAVIEDTARVGPVGIRTDEAEWLLAAARCAAGPREIAMHLPVAPMNGRPTFRSGATILFAVDRTDQELHQAMRPSKRRMLRRALDRGFRVREANELGEFRAFAELQRVTAARQGRSSPSIRLELPEPGESWREWELPWMWLLVASRDGGVEAGFGDGMLAGGVVEARTGASSAEALRDGVMALLSHEEARRVRDLGHRWINLGGDSVFKREAAGCLGERVPMHVWLSPGRPWRVGVYVESAWRNVRERAGAFARSFGWRGRGLFGGWLALPLADDWLVVAGQVLAEIPV